MTMNSAADILSKSHFVYPGPSCTDKQLAYVLPDGHDCNSLQLNEASIPCATYFQKFVSLPQIMWEDARFFWSLPWAGFLCQCARVFRGFTYARCSWQSLRSKCSH